MTSGYRGSLKHKNRPARGSKGTLCPEWTHATHATDVDGGFGGDPFKHRWESTVAHRLFDEAIPSDGDRRFATEKGIAFEAKPSGDGTWHGFPIPWESVPPPILKQWLKEGKVNRREIRLNKSPDANDIHWALGSDEP